MIRKCATLMLAVFVLHGHAAAVDLGYQVKAAYIYNILKFVSFPDDAFHVQGVVNICILGEDRFGVALDEINGAGVPQGIINIIHFDSGKGRLLDKCNAVYLVETEQRNFKSILSRIDSKQTLTISEFSPFIQYGGLIELYVQNDSIRFRINEKLVKETDFQVAAQLIQLGVRR